MDHGTDASIASRYHREHERADEAIAQAKGGIIQRIKDSRVASKLLKMPLRELLDRGYTPASIVAAGV